MKKLFITLLSLCTMSAAVFAESDYPQGAMNIEGTLLWKIQGGTMTIYGDDYQPMRNYSSMSDELRNFAGHEFQTIDMTKGITIGNYAFSGLEKLESVNLHGTSIDVNPIYYIGKNAFEGSSNLTSINSEALTDLRYIGERAFAGTAIKSFTVKEPAGGELMYYVQMANGFPVDLNLEHCYIGNEAFAGCRYLSTVYMNDATPFTGTYNGFLYEHTYLVVDNADVAATYRAAWESIADRIIYMKQNVTFSSEAFKEICVNNWDTNGDGELSYEEAFAVTTFGDAFKGNTELKEITINDLKPFVNVTVYESGLFEGCTNLEKITISPFVTDIADDAFKGCTSLKEIHFVTEIPFKENFTIETNERTHIIVPDAYLTTYDNTWTNKSELIIGESHIHFQCAKVKSRCISYYDTNKDGELSYSEATAVTSIGTIFQNSTYYTSFDELKYFTGLTAIDSYAFKSCSNLTSVNIPVGVKRIGGEAFYGCSSLVTVNIPKGVESIGSSVFYDCKSLISVNIPEGIKSFGGWVFYNCSSLMSVELPSGLTGIPQETFYQCSSLTSVNIPEGVKSIGSSAFYKCSSLTSVNIPEGVESIGNSAFQSCYLRKIDIPNSVTSIGKYAFSNTSLIEFSAVTPISYDDISSTATYIVPEDHVDAYKEAWPDDADYRIVGTGSIEWKEYVCEAQPTSSDLLARIGVGNELSVVRLKIIGSINSYDMMVMRNQMKNLRELDLTDANIVDNSYNYGSGTSVKDVFPDFLKGLPITSVQLPLTITSIGNSAFYGCDHIETISIPANVASIGSDAFCYCYGLKSIELTEGCLLETINSGAFMHSGVHFSSLDFTKASNLKTIGNNVFKYSKYKHISLPNSVTQIGQNAFSSSKIIEISTTASIGQEAFKDCSNLENVLIKEGATAIDANAFENCTALKDVKLAASLTTIDNYAFKGCTSLKSIVLPDALTSLGKYVFSGCNALEKAEFGINITSVPEYLFQNCSALKDVRLSPKTKTIKGYAFTGCTALQDLHLPPYLNKIESYAFNGVKSLKNIYAYMPDVPAIDLNTFGNYTTCTLYIPPFLFDAYYYATGWSQFLYKHTCDLRPGDYEAFYTNKDLYFKEGEERITLDRPIVELGNQGSIIVEGANQEFTTVDMLRGTTSSSLIGDGNIVMDELRVKIEVAANRWYFLCFPYDVEIDGCEYPGKYAWRYYDGAVRAQNGSGGWQKIEGNKLTAGMGYIFQSNTAGNLIVKFSDPEFGGDRPVSLEAHNCTNAADASWNFVGNPYASYYNVEVEDFTSPITVWNGTTYVAYRPGDDDYHLQPYEAFFVQKTENDGAVNFEAERRETYTMSQATAAAKARASRERGITPERLIVNLTVSDNDTAVIDRTRLVMNAKASRNYETDCDASKFISDDAVAQIYTVEGTVKMAINERPGDGEVRLGYIASKKGTLRIEAQRMDVPMEIIDTETNTTHDLSEGAYVFTTKAGTFDKRFVIRTSRSATGIISLTAATGVAIGMTDGGLTIGGAEGKTVGIHTVGGALVAEHNGNGHVALPGGTYVVTVDGYSTKVFVK